MVWGFHAGVQAQFGNWVIGAETAFSLPTDFNARSNYVLLPESRPGQLRRLEDRQLFTAGLKLGYAWDKWLFAVNGGYARADIYTRSFVIATNVFNDATLARHDGWYVGASLEYVMHKGTLVDVIGGFDYQHIALDTNQHNPLQHALRGRRWLLPRCRWRLRHGPRSPDHQDQGLGDLLPPARRSQGLEITLD